MDHASPGPVLVIANDKAGRWTPTTSTAPWNSASRRTGSWGNVDVRQEVTIGAYSGDLVAAQHQGGVRFFSVDQNTRQLTQINDRVLAPGLGEGLCLYRSPLTHTVYGIQITIQGVVTQYEILDSDNNGLLETHVVRQFSIGSESEGCVADDDTGALYVSEEDALWRYSAEPEDGTTRAAVDVLESAGGIWSATSRA